MGITLQPIMKRHMMRNTFSFALMVFLLFCLSQNSYEQSISNQQKEEIGERVDSIFHCMIKSAENLDFDQLCQGVDDKHSAGFILNGVYFSHFDSLINTLRGLSGSAIRQSITLLNEKVSVLSQNIVVLTAFGISNVEINDGNHKTSKFFWSFVYEKEGPHWKVIQSHQSSIR